MSKEWIKKNCPTVPTILVERDSFIMDVTDNFEDQIASNEDLKTDLKYGIPELNEDNIRHF